MYILGNFQGVEVTATKARDQLGRLIDRAYSEPVYLTRHSRRVGAIVDADTRDHLMEAAVTLRTSRPMTRRRLKVERPSRSMSFVASSACDLCGSNRVCRTSSDP
jgi:prevent-host-death family protein